MPDKMEVQDRLRDTPRRWLREIDSYHKIFRSWQDDAKKITTRYAMRDPDIEDYNILWSNVQTILPRLFSQAPTPIVQRRYKDKDQIARMSATVLERALATEIDGYDWTDTFQRSVLDTSLVARGVAWVRYEPEILRDEQGEMIGDEKAPIDYVHWSDFAHSPLMTWAEIERGGWIARRIMMTREQGVERFGDIFNQVSLMGADNDVEPSATEKKRDVTQAEAEVWELWSAHDKKRRFFSKGYPEKHLEVSDDPLGLKNFFPCPKPIYGSMCNEGLVPIPDYLQYQQQAVLCDTLTYRISRLQEALRVVGFYDASASGLETLLRTGQYDNVMIKVEGLAETDIRGSGQNRTGVVQWLPIDMVATTLLAMYDVRDRTKAEIYELTGISDIIRGHVDPREKLGQSQMKGRFAGQRMETRRNNVDDNIKNCLRIKAEIMCEHFTSENLRELSCFDQLPEVGAIQQQAGEMAPMIIEQLWQAIVMFLRDDRTRGMRIEIETDSTIALDKQEDQENTIQFMSGMTDYMRGAAEIVAGAPEMKPLLGEMMLFAVRKFRVGRTLEYKFEEMVDQMANQPPQQAQEGPDPNEQLKAQTEQTRQQTASLKAQADNQKAIADIQKTQIETQSHMQKLRADLEAFMAKKQIETQTALHKAAAQND